MSNKQNKKNSKNNSYPEAAASSGPNDGPNSASTDQNKSSKKSKVKNTKSYDYDIQLEELDANMIVPAKDVDSKSEDLNSKSKNKSKDGKSSDLNFKSEKEFNNDKSKDKALGRFNDEILEEYGHTKTVNSNNIDLNDNDAVDFDNYNSETTADIKFKDVNHDIKFHDVNLEDEIDEDTKAILADEAAIKNEDSIYSGIKKSGALPKLSPAPTKLPAELIDQIDSQLMDNILPDLNDMKQFLHQYALMQIQLLDANSKVEYVIKQHSALLANLKRGLGTSSIASYLSTFAPLNEDEISQIPSHLSQQHGLLKEYKPLSNLAIVEDDSK